MDVLQKVPDSFVLSSWRGRNGSPRNSLELNDIKEYHKKVKHRTCKYKQMPDNMVIGYFLNGIKEDTHGICQPSKKQKQHTIAIH